MCPADAQGGAGRRRIQPLQLQGDIRCRPAGTMDLRKPQLDLLNGGTGQTAQRQQYQHEYDPYPGDAHRQSGNTPVDR